MSKIAIIGASANRDKFGNKAVRCYLQRGDTVYPVHPSLETIEGAPAYRSILDVPDDVEVASFYVPPSVGLTVIEDVARKGIKRVLLNPGSQSDELLARARELGTDPLVACSILLAGRSPAEF